MAVVGTTEEDVSVKVSFGNELRRVSCSGSSSFAALRDLVVQLYRLPSPSVNIRYQDDEGDLITISTDGEVREALQQAKIGLRNLRLFVEARANDVQPTGRYVEQPVVPALASLALVDSAPTAPSPAPPVPVGPLPVPVPVYVPVPASAPVPVLAPTAAATAPPQFTPSPDQGRHGRRGKKGHHENHHHGRHGRHSSPAEHSDLAPSKNEVRDAFKQRKQAMRDTFRAMKENASTPEEKLAAKDYKAKMKAECKAVRKESKSDRKRVKYLKAKHVADVTIPDGSLLPADTLVTKTWKMKNTGTAAWPVGSQLIVAGRRDANLHGPEKGAMEAGPVLPEQLVDVSVTFITPSEPGRYVCYYRMVTADGDKFGKKVWVSFVIAAPTGDVMQ
jgi:hypothetical protein